MQQQGHGRGGNRPEEVGRDMRMGMGVGMGMGMGMGMSMGMPYGPMAGPEFAWGYGYPLPIPTQSVFRPPAFGRGMQRPNFPLGMQSPGVLKRSGGPSQGPVNHGRGYSRGYGGRAWGGRGRGHARGRDLLTKEALDADLDEWRLKDKKSAGQSLDADLDEYWSRKDDGSDQNNSELKEKSSDSEKKGSLDTPKSNVHKRTERDETSLRPSKNMRGAKLSSEE